MKNAAGLTLKSHTSYFPALTGVRAIAAFLVYVHHVRAPQGNIPDWLFSFMTAGHIGVTVFFVLSGFLISYRYAEALEHKQIGFGNYLIRRVARIYPLYFVLSLIILFWQRDFSGWHWFLNLSLLKGFFDMEKFSGIAQGWSLTVEESFYLTAPLLFYGFRKSGLGTVLLVLMTGATLVGLAKIADSESFMGNLHFMADFTLFGRIFEFYCGYQLARIYKNRSSKAPSGSFFTLWGSVLALAGYALVAFAQGKTFTFPFPVTPETVANNFVLPLGIGLWFYGLISEKTWLRDFLGSRLFQVLGKSSYAFYLIHAGWFFEVIYFHIYPSKITTFFFLNIGAIAIYYCFEEPLNQYIRRKADARELKKKLQQAGFPKQKA